ncbi:MAG: hypothetical protein JWR59_619 [Brevundimonas sp.]|nr:hypothetical protein [Brevundimonas sp.]
MEIIIALAAIAALVGVVLFVRSRVRKGSGSGRGGGFGGGPNKS